MLLKVFRPCVFQPIVFQLFRAASSVGTPMYVRTAIMLLIVAIGIVWEKGSAAQDIAAPPPEAHSFRAIRGVTYVEREQVPLKADLYVPTGAGPYPGIVMVHGGAWRAGDRWQVYSHARVMAEGGYVVMAISYRLAPAHKFPAQIDDCRSALRWFREHCQEFKVDPTRIAGYGYSAGAHLVCLLGVTNGPEQRDSAQRVLAQRDLAQPNDRIQAIVAGGTPSDFDWVPRDGQVMSFLFGGPPSEFPDLYRQASPLEFVSADDPPVFLFHGENDLLVPRRLPDRFSKKLREVGVPTEFVEIPDVGHIGAFLDKGIPLRAREFLDKTLKVPPAKPSIGTGRTNGAP